MPDSETDRLNCIIDFGCVEVGKREWNTLSEFEKQLWRENPLAAWRSSKVDLTKDSHLETLIGAHRLNVRFSDVRGPIARHARLERHLRAFEQRHGGDVRVRLATDLVFEARDESGISFAEIAVLSGIYSKVGAAKTPVRITREEIRRRAHGCKSKNVFQAEMSNRAIFLTERQTRSIIDRLHQRGFFARLTFARRQTYYSNRLTADQLAEAVFQLKTRAAKTRYTRIQANSDITSRIRAERHRLAGSDPTEAT